MPFPYTAGTLHLVSDDLTGKTFEAFRFTGEYKPALTQLMRGMSNFKAEVTGAGDLLTNYQDGTVSTHTFYHWGDWILREVKYDDALFETYPVGLPERHSPALHEIAAWHSTTTDPAHDHLLPKAKVYKHSDFLEVLAQAERMRGDSPGTLRQAAAPKKQEYPQEFHGFTPDLVGNLVQIVTEKHESVGILGGYSISEDYLSWFFRYDGSNEGYTTKNGQNALKITKINQK